MSVVKPEFRLRHVAVQEKPAGLAIYYTYASPHQATPAAGSAAVTLASVLEMTEGGNAPVTGPQRPVKSGANGGRESSIVFAHTESVRALCFTPDGSTLVSGAADGRVKLWDFPEGRLRRTLETHPGWINKLAVSSDGQKLVSGCSSATIKCWSLPDGTLLDSWKAHTGGIDALASIPGTEFFASASQYDHQTLKVWSYEDRKLAKEFYAEPHGVCHLVASPDGSLISWDGSRIQFRSLQQAGVLESTERFNGGHSLALSPNGETLALAGFDGIKLWFVPFREHLCTLPLPQTISYVLAFTPDNKHLVSRGFDKQIIIWDLATGRSRNCMLTTHPISALAVSPDGQTIAIGDGFGVIYLWSRETGTQVGQLFDPAASKTDAFTYNTVDQQTGRLLTYTLPCGSPIPPGATCVCNCVPGTYRPPATPVPSGPGTTYCTCNKVCTCIPVCQAHELLHPDDFVRRMAEQLLLVMGRSELAYMEWAANGVSQPLERRIRAVMQDALRGVPPDPTKWPTPAECVRYLDHANDVVAIMAAQMLERDRSDSDWKKSTTIVRKVAERMQLARQRAWNPLREHWKGR